MTPVNFGSSCSEGKNPCESSRDDSQRIPARPLIENAAGTPIGELAKHFMDDLRHKALHPVIRIENAQIVIYDVLPNGDLREAYDIPERDVYTAEGFAFWVRQLSEKSWITMRHLERFAAAVIAINESSKQLHAT